MSSKDLLGKSPHRSFSVEVEGVPDTHTVSSSGVSLEKLLDDIHAAVRIEPYDLHIKRDDGRWDDIALAECGCLDEWPEPVNVMVTPYKGLKGVFVHKLGVEEGWVDRKRLLSLLNTPGLVGAYDPSVVNNAFLRVREGNGYSVARLRGVNRGMACSTMLYVTLVKGGQVMADFKGIDTVSNKPPTHAEVCEWATALRACDARVPTALEMRFAAFIIQLTEEALAHKLFTSGGGGGGGRSGGCVSGTAAAATIAGSLGVSVSEAGSEDHGTSSAPSSAHATPRGSFRRKMSAAKLSAASLPLQPGWQDACGLSPAPAPASATPEVFFKNPLLHSGGSFHSPCVLDTGESLSMFFTRVSPMGPDASDPTYSRGGEQSYTADHLHHHSLHRGIPTRPAPTHPVSPYSYSCARCRVCPVEGRFVPYTDADISPRGFWNGGPPVAWHGAFVAPAELRGGAADAVAAAAAAQWQGGGDLLGQSAALASTRGGGGGGGGGGISIYILRSKDGVSWGGEAVVPACIAGSQGGSTSETGSGVGGCSPRLVSIPTRRGGGAAEGSEALLLFYIGAGGICRASSTDPTLARWDAAGLGDDAGGEVGAGLVLPYPDLQPHGISPGCIKTLSIVEGVPPGLGGGRGGGGWTLLVTFDSCGEGADGGRVAAFVASDPAAGAFVFAGEVEVRRGFRVAEDCGSLDHIHRERKGFIDTIDSASLYRSSSDLWYLIISCKVQGEHINRVVAAFSSDQSNTWSVLDFHD